MKYLFNRNPIKQTATNIITSEIEIKREVGLFRASLDDASKYGGNYTRQVIEFYDRNVKSCRNFQTVDVKVHMLMPGMYPAIPGWHTDHAPRMDNGSPSGKGTPNLELQEELTKEGKSTKFHLFCSPATSLTEFLVDPLLIDIPSQIGTKLYKYLTDQLNPICEDIDNPISLASIKKNHLLEFDWWNIHRGIAATRHEWRLLIRIADSDFVPPFVNKDDFIRTQQQVYVPESYGW